MFFAYIVNIEITLILIKIVLFLFHLHSCSLHETWKILQGIVYYREYRGIGGKSRVGRHFYYTRLLGRFAPIFYLNCEHVLFVYIVKQNKQKFEDFLNFKLNY